MADIGTIKWFDNAVCGFGFAIPDNGEGDIFVHVSAVTPGVQLKQGDRISYDTRMGNVKYTPRNVDFPLAARVSFAQGTHKCRADS
jgi:cold shock protein